MKKAIAILICSILMVTLITGCGKKKNDKENKPNSNETVSKDKYTSLDTKKFDSSKHNKIIYLNGQELNCPIKVSELQSKGFTIKQSGGDASIEAGDWNNAFLQQIVNGEEDPLVGIDGERIINKSNETKSVSDTYLAQIFYDYSIRSYFGVDNRKSEDARNVKVEDIVNILGNPSEIKHPLMGFEGQMMYIYKYQDYTLDYHFTKKEDGWYSISMYYSDNYYNENQ